MWKQCRVFLDCILQASPFPKICPEADLGDAGIDASNDPSLYDEPAVPTSPFVDAMKSGAAASRKSKVEGSMVSSS